MKHTWEPPQGIARFVSLLQQVGPEEAAGLLRLAFETAGAHAVLSDFKLRSAAPVLLLACKQARAAFERREALDWQALEAAIRTAEEQPQEAIVG